MAFRIGGDRRLKRRRLILYGDRSVGKGSSGGIEHTPFQDGQGLRARGRRRTRAGPRGSPEGDASRSRGPGNRDWVFEGPRLLDPRPREYPTLRWADPLRRMSCRVFREATALTLRLRRQSNANPGWD